MKNTNKKFTRKAAAILAATMMMTTATAITASADSTEIKSDEFVCIWDVPEKKTPSLFEQIQKWVELLVSKKTEPQKKRLVELSQLEIQRLIKEEYNMTLRQFYDAANYVKSCLAYNLGLEQTEMCIRDGMRRVERFGWTPTWNEDMIRFLKDYWDEFTEFVLANDYESFKV